MEASQAVQVVTIGQVLWVAGGGLVSIVAGVITAARWFRGAMREETAGVRQEVAGVKTDLAELKAAMPQTIRQEVDAAISRHEVNETRALAQELGPVRERLAVLETLTPKSKAKRARA